MKKLKTFQKKRRIYNNRKEIILNIKLSYILIYTLLSIVLISVLSTIVILSLEMNKANETLFSVLFTAILILLIVILGYLALQYKNNKTILNSNFILQEGVILYWKNVDEIYLIEKKRKKTYLVVRSSNSSIEIQENNLNYQFPEITETAINFWSLDSNKK